MLASLTGLTRIKNADQVCVNLQLSQLKKEDLVALGKAIDGFLSSDIGKMAQVVVFAAFPEMKIVKDVAMPVMRQFIKKVTTKN